MSVTSRSSDGPFRAAYGTGDYARRRFLTHATVGLGAAGLLFAAVPFIESWLPSERARALGGPVTVDVSEIAGGQMLLVVWRRKPIYIVHRTENMLALLGNHDGRLKDPDSRDSQQPSYATNPYRSVRPSLFVTIGICTHLGCLPHRGRRDDGCVVRPGAYSVTSVLAACCIWWVIAGSANAAPPANTMPSPAYTAHPPTCARGYQQERELEREKALTALRQEPNVPIAPCNRTLEARTAHGPPLDLGQRGR